MHAWQSEHDMPIAGKLTGEAMRKGSVRSAATASFTVAKVSSTYCAHAVIESPGLPLSLP